MKKCLYFPLQGDGKDVKDAKEEAGPYWSLMFEVSESYCKPVNQKQIKLAGEEWSEIVKETITGAINTKLVSAEDQIVSIYHRSANYPCACSGLRGSQLMLSSILGVTSNLSACFRRGRLNACRLLSLHSVVGCFCWQQLAYIHSCAGFAVARATLVGRTVSCCCG